MRAAKPFIGIPADRRLLGKHWFHAVGEKYIAAVAQAAEATPVLIPALGADLDMGALLERFDGLLLTGSLSNVEPAHYQGPPSEPGTLHDPHRDATTLPLIRGAIDAGVPVLGLCRGFQEMNVALGGTLWQKLHEAGFDDHREDLSQPLEVQYGPAHPIVLEAGGVLRSLTDKDRETVNSLHSQGVQTLAPGLDVEARATDGVVEAFRVRAARSFALAVQWHPEWQVMNNPFSRALFAAFGAASRERAAHRNG
ncbi:MAG: gamma-glutamyl-gamma-aminobutyrate hydrolase family protein [Gammaproteobacteria bacterium]|nr:gamma-glutamyl-gamma-aminobutyrate hydrolase family protein [Gammaproteobacteria bacterium]